MSPATHDVHTRRILDRVAESEVVSQRSLARELGIALGLTNLLIRRLAAKGWIRIVRIRPNSVRYMLTPTGFAQKARLSRDYLVHSVRFYTEARDRIRQSFMLLSAEWRDGTAGEKRIVFFGAGEVAEIAYVCLQETDLRLVGVVDERRTKPFFEIPVSSPHALTPSHLADTSFDRIVIMSFDDGSGIRARLEALKIPPDRVFWL